MYLFYAIGPSHFPANHPRVHDQMGYIQPNQSRIAAANFPVPVNMFMPPPIPPGGGGFFNPQHPPPNARGPGPNRGPGFGGPGGGRKKGKGYQGQQHPRQQHAANGPSKAGAGGGSQNVSQYNLSLNSTQNSQVTF